MNDFGRIAGTYAEVAGNYFAVLKTQPVPEPGSLTLSAVAGIAGTAWRRRHSP